MNRRLLYAILIVVILILLFNHYILGHTAASPNTLKMLSVLNVVAALGFATVLFYKWQKFSNFDKKIQALPKEDQDEAIMMSLDSEDLPTFTSYVKEKIKM